MARIAESAARGFRARRNPQRMVHADRSVRRGGFVGIPAGGGGLPGSANQRLAKNRGWISPYHGHRDAAGGSQSGDEPLAH